MKYILSLILFTLLIACSNKNIKKSPCNDSLFYKTEAYLTNNTVTDFSDTVDVLLGNDVYSLKLNIDPNNEIDKYIQVYLNGQKHQKIKFTDYVEGNYIQLIDWNFDGFSDISVVYSSGSGGISYMIYNFNPIKGTFLKDKKLSGKGLLIDSVNHFIVDHWRTGADSEDWDTFTYKNGKLNFVKGFYLERYSNEKGYFERHTRSKLVNNKRIQTVDSVLLDNKN
jgi:hypothetical protein